MAKAFLVKMIGFDIPIEEDEVIKVVDGVNRGVVKILKQGIMNPTSFAGIIEDKNREKIIVNGTTSGESGHYENKPLKDLFPQLRGQLEQLANGVKAIDKPHEKN